MKSILPPRPARGTGVPDAKTVFHGTNQLDYQGRSWILPPASLKPDDEHVVIVIVFVSLLLLFFL